MGATMESPHSCMGATVSHQFALNLTTLGELFSWVQLCLTPVQLCFVFLRARFLRAEASFFGLLSSAIMASVQRIKSLVQWQSVAARSWLNINGSQFIFTG